MEKLSFNEPRARVFFQCGKLILDYPWLKNTTLSDRGASRHEYQDRSQPAFVLDYGNRWSVG